MKFLPFSSFLTGFLAYEINNIDHPLAKSQHTSSLPTVTPTVLALVLCLLKPDGHVFTSIFIIQINVKIILPGFLNTQLKINVLFHSSSNFGHSEFGFA